jgi:hypothetical protein
MEKMLEKPVKIPKKPVKIPKKPVKMGKNREKNGKKPKIIVDVDNILADFSPILYEELKKRCKTVPEPEKWTNWDFYKAHVEKNTFYEAVNAAQMRILETKPVPGAEKLMKFLHQHASVTLASHRKSESEDSLVKWLKQHCIECEHIDISFDKTRLFNDHYVLIIDDSPDTMKIALDHGLHATSPRYPWNECMEGTGAFIGDTMEDVQNYVKSIL